MSAVTVYNVVDYEEYALMCDVFPENVPDVLIDLGYDETGNAIVKECHSEGAKAVPWNDTAIQDLIEAGVVEVVYETHGGET